MRIPAYFILMSLFFLMLNCQFSNDKSNDFNTKQLSNPGPVIEDTLVRNLKFDVYCIFADTKFTFKDDSTNFIYYSECDLNIDTISEQNDTLKMGVHFYYKGKIVSSINLVQRGIRTFASLLYDIRQKKTIMYITDSNLGFYEVSPSSRLYIPLQPDVIEFIRKNQGLINPWFKKEALRRGII